jgi:predicted phage-related endonuclease
MEIDRKGTLNMSEIARRRQKTVERRYFIGGSDTRIIMGSEEAALLRLWREKRGESEPEDLSHNLIVQLGSVTEDLNRRWYEANTGRVIADIQRRVFHPALRWMTAVLRRPMPSSRPNSCCRGRSQRRVLP